ncbi:MAG TPA: thioester reductase domain-containing protein [Kofleriaceae bacterium]|nr:thioester reductase domain-containing protein [Kofleriaceae bacterium]
MTSHPIANDPLTSSSASRLRSELRAFALTHLPRAMVPAHFVVLRELPELPNGKIDRKSLPAIHDDNDVADHVAPRTAAEAQIAAIWQDLLGVTRVSVETSFFELGGDSLKMLQMSARVGEVYQIRLDLPRLLESPTVAHLARMVSAQAEPRLTGADNQRGIRPEDLLAEAVLPDDVVPEPGAIPAHAGPYRTILLTGGTGYTGAFLLREILDRSAARVCVIVRADDDATAARRVAQNLAEYGLLRDGDEPRIEGIAGDMARPYLGLPRRTYLDLAARAEIIFHNAADSSWTVPYLRIKPVNVLGGLEVLRLACRARVKPVHFVCSIAVYPGVPGEQPAVEAELTCPEHVAGGYRQSKWVIDKLMNRARDRGVPTYIYRVGAITGAHDTGACSTDTFINDLIKGCIQLGAVFDYDLMLELVPVNYCAAVIAHVALGSSAPPGVFNVPGARPVSMNEVIDLIVECGYPLRRLPYAEWYGELAAAIERGEDNQLARYLGLFGKDRPAPEIGYPGHRPVFGTERLRAALDGSGLRCPDVDLALWQRYIAYFVSIGFVPAPRADHRTS